MRRVARRIWRARTGRPAWPAPRALRSCKRPPLLIIPRPAGPHKLQAILGGWGRSDVLAWIIGTAAAPPVPRTPNIHRADHQENPAACSGYFAALPGGCARMWQHAPLLPKCPPAGISVWTGAADDSGR